MPIPNREKLSAMLSKTQALMKELYLPNTTKYLQYRISFDESKRSHKSDGEVTEPVFHWLVSSIHSQGAEGIVLGCTEIPMLIKQKDTELPLFDTLRVHSLAAVDFAIGE